MEKFKQSETLGHGLILQNGEETGGETRREDWRASWGAYRSTRMSPSVLAKRTTSTISPRPSPAPALPAAIAVEASGLSHWCFIPSASNLPERDFTQSLQQNADFRRNSPNPLPRGKFLAGESSRACHVDVDGSTGGTWTADRAKNHKEFNLLSIPSTGRGRRGGDMEDGSSLDGGREVAAPLVNQEILNRQFNDNVTFEGQGRSFLCCKTFDWRAPGIILGFQCLESLGFYGITTNLTIYLSSVLHESNSLIATRITTWTGTSYFAPFLGVLIADSYWGCCRMIFFSSLIYLCGMVIITLSASLQSLKPSPCQGNSCPSATQVQKIVFYFGLYLIAFGSGGVKSSLLPLGADQFDDENPAERMKQGSFFNWFYFCINVGALTSSTLIVWIQENVGWAVGYGIASLCMALAAGCFLIGTSLYKVTKPQGSPLKRVFQVLVACFHKANLTAPSDSSCLYEAQDNDFNIQGTWKLAHTKQFRFLDKAATMSDLDCKEGIVYSPWRLCTVTQVEELKLLLRLFPIWVASIVYSIAFSQMYTTFVEQGRAMNTKIGCFSIPPASLFACEVLSVMLWVLVYDMLIAKMARSYLGGGRGVTQLQRMGIGYVLMILAMTTAALVEMKRLKCKHDPKPISILWQLPQYVIVGGSEVFCYIGQLELFYDQGPDTMKTMSTAVSLLTISLGNYLSSIVVTFVTAVTTAGGRPGWIPDNLDEGHLDYFFWLMAGLCVLNFVAYLACARRFTLKKTIL